MNCSECGICIDHPEDTGGVCELPKSHLQPCATCEQRGLDAFSELGRKCARAVQSRLFDQILNGDGCSNAAYTNVPRGPSPMASALPLLDTIKRMEEQSKGQVPFRPAYLFMPPELLSHIPITTVEFQSSPSMMPYRVMMDYNVKLMSNSMMIPGSFIYSDIGGSDPYVPSVVWKDVEQPAKPSALIWCVVVAFLCWLLCAGCSALLLECCNGQGTDT